MPLAIRGTTTIAMQQVSWSDAARARIFLSGWSFSALQSHRRGVTPLPNHSLTIFQLDMSHPQSMLALGILETTGWTPAIVALDGMEKAAPIVVWHAELNDFLGVCIKIRGTVDAVRSAIDAGERIANQMRGDPKATVITRTTDAALRGIDSAVEFNPLIEQLVVHVPSAQLAVEKESDMSANSDAALGFIETQGFTAVIEAIDTACKAASVEVVGKEKLGGGYVTIVIRGDVAAVRAAIDAARPKVDGLGTLIAAHVITRPSPGVLGLLPSAPAKVSG